MTSACAPLPDPSEQPIVQIHSPSGLWGCLPYIIGFEPQESLILVFMGPRPRRVVLTLRIDLDLEQSPEANANVREMLITTLQRAQAHGVGVDLVHIITASARAAELPAAGVVLTTMLTADSCGVGTGEMFACDGAHLWFYDEWDGDGETGEPHALVQSEVDAARFALVTHGYGYAASRADLETALEPHPAGTFALREWQQALDRKDKALSGPARAQLRWRRAEEDHLVSSLMRSDLDAGEALHFAPRWAAALADAQIREPVMFRLLVHPRGAAARHTAALARDWLAAVTVRCPEVAVPPVAATLAAVSWQQGDGAFARIAAERALRADPGNSLGRLIAAAAVSGLPPSTWLNVLRAFGLEGLRRGEARPRYPDLLPS